MDEGNTADHQQDTGVNSTQADDSMSIDNRNNAATVSPVAPASSSPGKPAPDIVDISLTSEVKFKEDTFTDDIVNISLTSEVKLKEDTFTEDIENSAQEENVTSIPKLTNEGEVTQSKILEGDPSDKENVETIKQNFSPESVTSKQKSLQESAVRSNSDQGVSAAPGKSVEGPAVAETIKPETIEDAVVPDTGECEAVAEATLAEASAPARIKVEDPAVAEAIQDATATDTIPCKAVELTTHDKADVVTVQNGAVAKTFENPPDSAVASRAVEANVSGIADESTPGASSLFAGDHEQSPVSPSSEKEADLSYDGALHIDESGVAHSDNADDISHASSGTEQIALDNDEGESSMLCDKTGEILKEPSNKKDAISKGSVAVEKNTTATKTSCSIEESIERCIANNMAESSESDTPNVSPPKKRAASVATKPPESQKFPRNYGFKIITNKIDLCSNKPVLTTMPKLEASGIPLKKIKIKAKPIGESLVLMQDKVLQEKNSGADPLSPNALAKGIAIAVRKSTDESDASPPKERPTPGLKVRNVESINAAIRTVRAPVCPVYTEEVYKALDSASSANEKLPEQEMTDPATEVTEAEKESLLAANKLGRPIAPKCEPIASNDQQAIKLIRDLIQLPSMPVYVPDVSDSKHFNGRLHLCHGCGDRFVLLKSLLEHQNRRSCVIKFQCLKCDSSVLCFFNRCEFIRHLYNHNQTLTNVMLQYHITVERLPANNDGIFDVKICQECKTFLKVPLSEHMQGLDAVERKAADLVLKCQWCSLLLPTKCAYTAHRRMHFLQAPHVCPECGDVSPDLPAFNVHINSVCFHTSKRSLFTCSHCKVEMYDARKLERHIRLKHIRDVFKCNFCFVACFNLKDLDKHRHQHHEERVAEEEEDNDETGLKYAFHLCDMCPNRLIRRIRLGNHVWDHAYTNNEVTYVYECRKCKVSFGSKEALSAHSGICTAASTAANTPAFSTAIANGSDILVEQPNSMSSEVFVIEGPPPGFDLNTEMESDGAERVEDEEDLVAVDETEAPPPLQKAPITLKVTQPSAPVLKPLPPPMSQCAVPTVSTSSVKVVSRSILQVPSKPVEGNVSVPEKKKKKKASPKKSPAKPDVATVHELNDDNSFNSFESELFMDADDPDAGEGGMEVVLNCLECGTNLTSELGSYCTLCEQKREAGSQSFKTAPLSNTILGPSKKKAPKKFPISGGNFTCRICNDLISRTCDRAAIKRHFITKHKEIFIAALQTGMNANQNGPKLSRPNILSHKRTSDSTSPAKNSPAASASKVTKKKKKARKPMGGHVSQSDTDEDSLVSTSPAKEAKKAKDKRKKTYSPTFPALEEGMVASEEKGTENRENMRYCYKCSFKSSDKDEFMTHVATHKTNPKDLQCPACGMCFVVRPSLEKHLVILHGMKNVYAYLLEHGFPPLDKSSQDAHTEMLEINQCRVCHAKFDSEAMLEKHFRTHGSAFLMSKQFRRS